MLGCVFVSPLKVELCLDLVTYCVSCRYSCYFAVADAVEKRLKLLKCPARRKISSSRSCNSNRRRKPSSSQSGRASRELHGTHRGGRHPRRLRPHMYVHTITLLILSFPIRKVFSKLVMFSSSASGNIFQNRLNHRYRNLYIKNKRSHTYDTHGFISKFLSDWCQA